MSALDGIPTDTAPINYTAHRTVETLIQGRDLREGMVVLLADRALLGTLSRIKLPGDDDQPYRAELSWCRVSALRFIPARQYNASYSWQPVMETTSAQISFIGEYADGSLIPRSRSAEQYWIVRLDSIPAVSE